MSKTALITGPTSGIGRETALALGGMGYRLFLLCRNGQAGQQLADEIAALPGALPPQVLQADLGDFAAVKAAAEQFLAAGEPLDVLINNAGIVNAERIVEDGIEQMFRVNHLGHFLLTRLLLERLKASHGRIVVVASDAHAFCPGIQFDDINFAHNFSTFKTYGHSKLANMLMTHSLAHKLKGSGVVVNCLHPGAVASRLGSNNRRWFTPLLMLMMKLFFISTQKGADTVIYLATSDDVHSSGNYYYKRRTRGSKRWARSDEDAEKLWQLSEQLLDGYL